MKSLWLVLLFAALSEVSALGQDAKANITPPEVEAGKPITITLQLDRAPSTDSANLIVTLAPKETIDNPAAFALGVGATGKGSNVYSNTTIVPLNAKGVWYVRDAYSQVSNISTPIVLSDHPEFTVKPTVIVLPKSGKVTITVP